MDDETYNKLVVHYSHFVAALQRDILKQVPAIPFVPAPKGLSRSDRLSYAKLLADAHKIAQP